jgi:hypothetical protein
LQVRHRGTERSQRSRSGHSGSRLGGSRPAQLLLLDEPTNHRDLAWIGVLENALAGYDGALLIVTTTAVSSMPSA